MEKLIKLLNEYKIYTDHKNSRMSEYIWINVWDDIVMDSYVWTTKDKTLEIISKKFWFIQRLVKHFMLDMTKIDSRIALSDFNATDRMLMALAISDNPIELLIDCLE